MLQGIMGVQKLQNGATVLLRHKIDGTPLAGESIVLALYHGEYVTWRVSADNNAWSGRYFQDRQVDAVKNWLDRIKDNIA